MTQATTCLTIITQLVTYLIIITRLATCLTIITQLITCLILIAPTPAYFTLIAPLIICLGITKVQTHKLKIRIFVLHNLNLADLCLFLKECKYYPFSN